MTFCSGSFSITDHATTLQPVEDTLLPVSQLLQTLLELVFKNLATGRRLVEDTPLLVADLLQTFYQLFCLLEVLFARPLFFLPPKLVLRSQNITKEQAKRVTKLLKDKYRPFLTSSLQADFRLTLPLCGCILY